MLKLLVYDDKGCLSLHGENLSFQGMRQVLHITNIYDVQLASQTPNLPWHIVGATVLLFLLTSRGAPVIVAVPIIVCTVLLAFSIGFATKWVKVTYQIDGSVGHICVKLASIPFFPTPCRPENRWVRIALEAWP